MPSGVSSSLGRHDLFFRGVQIFGPSLRPFRDTIQSNCYRANVTRDFGTRSLLSLRQILFDQNIPASEDHHGARTNEHNDVTILPPHAQRKRPVLSSDGISLGQWARFLQRRERLRGLKGIEDVWQASRGHDLPLADTPAARILWGTLLKSTNLTLPLVEHAADLYRRHGQTYPHIYELYMSHWLPLAYQARCARAIVDFHDLILVELADSRIPLRELAVQGRSQFSVDSFEVLLALYLRSNEADCYDAVMPALVAQRQWAVARRWHAACMSRNDRPASVETKAWIGSDDQLLLANLTTPPTGSHLLNEQLLHRLEGSDIAPVRYDDAFCARLFATKALSMASTVQGLAFAGINEIGPLAVRAMASRTKSAAELSANFAKLRSHGIFLQGCVYSVALQKFAEDGREELVRSMLASDLHHEAFEDVSLQEAVLDRAIQDGKADVIHRTLSILAFLRKDMPAESWNQLLQARIARSDRDLILPLLHDMRKHGVLVSLQSVIAIKSMLRPRRKGKRPYQGKFDDLRFVSRAFIISMEGGIAKISPLMWREIMRRYGMAGRLRELRRLMFWLLRWYAPRQGTAFAALPKPKKLDEASMKLAKLHSLKWRRLTELPVHNDIATLYVGGLFSETFYQGLIVWGFRAALLPNAPTEQSLLSAVASKPHHRESLLEQGLIRPQPWSQGLKMVVQLRNIGVKVERKSIVTALRVVFINLFRPGQAPNRTNRAMESANRKTMSAYAAEAEEIWGGPLFKDSELQSIVVGRGAEDVGESFRSDAHKDYLQRQESKRLQDLAGTSS